LLQQLCVGLAAADKRDKLNLRRKLHHAQDQTRASALAVAEMVIAAARRRRSAGMKRGGSWAFSRKIYGI
jgi:hypothetical protein